MLHPLIVHLEVRKLDKIFDDVPNYFNAALARVSDYSLPTSHVRSIAYLFKIQYRGAV